MKSEFNPDTYLGLLRVLLENPPSDRVVDPMVLRWTREFLSESDYSAVAVWNFYKKTLDHIVHGSLGSSFIVTLFDLESSTKPPKGGYAQADGSINSAPWRQKA